MPIRSKPLREIVEADLVDLIKREIREDRTLDFKQELRLDDSGKLDLLQDITAMANAAGGMLLYGAVEGKTDDRGMIVAVKGMTMVPDEIQSQVENLLRDSIDERIHGLEHRAIPLSDGSYGYVIRVPQSALAPHMITRKSSRARFYLRGTTSNDPMTAGQIKELAVRVDSAVERAKEFLGRRTELVRTLAEDPTRKRYGISSDRSALLLHIVPLLPRLEALDLADDSTKTMVRKLKPLMSAHPGALRWSLDGLYHEPVSNPRGSWALLTRAGAIEYARIQLAQPPRWEGQQLSIHIVWLEQALLNAVSEVEQFASSIVSPPFILSVRMLQVKGTQLASDNTFWGSENIIEDNDVLIEPEIVTGWGVPVQRAMRRSFDVLWQAWGHERSLLYNPDGSRKK